MKQKARNGENFRNKVKNLNKLSIINTKYQELNIFISCHFSFHLQRDKRTSPHLCKMLHSPYSLGNNRVIQKKKKKKQDINVQERVATYLFINNSFFQHLSVDFPAILATVQGFSQILGMNRTEQNSILLYHLVDWHLVAFPLSVKCVAKVLITSSYIGLLYSTA